jgi:hypothetical protein
MIILLAIKGIYSANISEIDNVNIYEATSKRLFMVPKEYPIITKKLITLKMLTKPNILLNTKLSLFFLFINSRQSKIMIAKQVTTIEITAKKSNFLIAHDTNSASNRPLFKFLYNFKINIGLVVIIPNIPIAERIDETTI